MKVIKVMNNSLILAKDKNSKEIIVMGKGIGFNAKINDDIDSSKIEKIFVLKSEINLIEQTPNEYIDIVNYIIEYASSKLNTTFNNQLFISLVDHISYAIERYNKNIIIQNRLLYEVKKFYPKEFCIAAHSVEYINRRLHVNLPEEECANIAFHLVNAQTESNSLQETILSVKIYKDILNIVRYSLKKDIDTTSINYSRFETHIQFFIQRLLDDKLIVSDSIPMFDQITQTYPDEYNCSINIKNYLQNTLQKDIGSDELFYLTLHLARVSLR